MDPELPEAVVELASTARRAFADAGGVNLARRAEASPDARAGAADVLRALGAFDIRPLENVDEALAAFELCREAGRVALPYPLDAVLCRVHDDGHERAVVLVDPIDALIDHGDLLDEIVDDIVAVDLDRRTYEARVSGTRLGSRLAPFAVPVTLAPSDAPATVDHAATMAWALSAATLLGYAEGALHLAVEHVSARHQFGQRIADFQAVQFQVADAVVAVHGLAELGAFTMWRIAEFGAGARADALSLRLHADDVSRVVLRIAQQLHGAAGVAEEYDISVLCRRAQAHVRIPVSSERLVDALAHAIRQDGFASLFPHGNAGARA